MTIITLANIKYAAFASEETSCYSATVLKDGKPIGTASNDGHGGCDYFYPIGVAFNAFDHQTLNAEIRASYPDVTFYEFTSPLETICGRLLAAHLAEKDLKKQLKTKILAVRPDGRVVAWSIKQRGKLPATPAQIDSLKATNKAKGYRFLDEMPAADAIKAYTSL
jgi:hypothetical protein